MDTFFVDILKDAILNNASDIYLNADHAPLIRVGDQLMDSVVKSVLATEQLKEVCFRLANNHIIRSFEQKKSVTFSMTIDDVGRFFVSFTLNANSKFSAHLRILPLEPPDTLGDLDMSFVVENLLSFQQGLLLITGPPRSGKSTTMASFVEHINKTHTRMITVIDHQLNEFIYQSKKSIITQLELGVGFMTWSEGILRMSVQRPDVIVIPEISDLPTLEAALQASESSLVITTARGSHAIEVFQRLVEYAPPDPFWQAMIHRKLARMLAGVISLRLLPRINRPGMVMATEICALDPKLQQYLLDKNYDQFEHLMAKRIPGGTEPLDFAIARLLHYQIVSRESAVKVALDPSKMLDFARGVLVSPSLFDRARRRGQLAPEQTAAAKGQIVEKGLATALANAGDKVGERDAAGDTKIHVDHVI